MRILLLVPLFVVLAFYLFLVVPGELVRRAMGMWKDKIDRVTMTIVDGLCMLKIHYALPLLWVYLVANTNSAAWQLTEEQLTVGALGLASLLLPGCIRMSEYVQDKLRLRGQAGIHRKYHEAMKRHAQEISAELWKEIEERLAEEDFVKKHKESQKSK